jgi:polyhydroxyalkanoate synthesis regulator phasin
MNIKEWQTTQEQCVKEYQELVATGHLTEGEFIELVEDLVDVKRISDDLSLEDNKIKAQKAIDAIKLIAGLI